MEWLLRRRREISIDFYMRNLYDYIKSAIAMIGSTKFLNQLLIRAQTSEPNKRKGA